MLPPMEIRRYVTRGSKDVLGEWLADLSDICRRKRECWRESIAWRLAISAIRNVFAAAFQSCGLIGVPDIGSITR